MGTVVPIGLDNLGEEQHAPIVKRILNENELYALIVVEQKSLEFQETRLVEATKNCQAIEQQLAWLNQKREQALIALHEVRGAIAGCGALITEELAKLGVSNETFEEQKAEYFAELEASKSTTPEK